MKSKKYTLFFFCLTLLQNGCKDNPIESSPLNNIKKIITSEDIYTEYFYKGHLLAKKEIIEGDEIISSDTFTYDDKGKLIRKDYFSTAAGVPLFSYLTYEYSANNILVKTNSYPKINNVYEFRGYTLYEYNENKLTKYSYYNFNDELSNYCILKYQGDNIIEDAQYDGSNNLQYLEKFEYDNKLNPLTKDLSFISAFTQSKNNIIKWTNTYFTVNPPNIIISTSSYTYNNLGYPIKRVTVYNRNKNGIAIQDTSTSYYEYY